MSRDVRQGVIEGTVLATLAQLRAAVQRVADANQRAEATEQAAAVLLALASDALLRALPDAADDALALVSPAMLVRLDEARSDPAVARSLDALVASAPFAIREALRTRLAQPAVPPEDPESEDPCSTD